MPLQIQIPAREIMTLPQDRLILDKVERCSRCDRVPADHFETHRLKLNIGIRSTHLLGKKFTFSKKYILGLRVCESCYQSDFLTHPEALKDDKTPLGRVSRVLSLTWMIGSLLAGAGFLLLTPLVPALQELVALKAAWRLPVIAGVLVLFTAWIMQRRQQGIVLTRLENNEPGWQPHPRAVIENTIVTDLDHLDEIALGIMLENTKWAEESAAHYHWKTAILDDNVSPGKNPE